uniref:Uncharacterized protein n=1 Tax=Seriola lalandi dorsalis TaxID=1841481 RepID=A0A3B4Y4V6_SERLL
MFLCNMTWSQRKQKHSCQHFFLPFSSSFCIIQGQAVVSAMCVTAVVCVCHALCECACHAVCVLHLKPEIIPTFASNKPNHCNCKFFVLVDIVKICKGMQPQHIWGKTFDKG